MHWYPLSNVPYQQNDKLPNQHRCNAKLSGSLHFLQQFEKGEEMAHIYGLVALSNCNNMLKITPVTCDGVGIQTKSTQNSWLAMIWLDQWSDLHKTSDSPIKGNIII